MPYFVETAPMLGMYYSHYGRSINQGLLLFNSKVFGGWENNCSMLTLC